jgi:hypothetical protein
VEMNGLITAMAAQEGALVADLHAAFMSTGDTSDLFSDHVHPNQRGYELMSQTWFDALTRPRGPGARSSFTAEASPTLFAAPRLPQGTVPTPGGRPPTSVRR